MKRCGKLCPMLVTAISRFMNCYCQHNITTANINCRHKYQSVKWSTIGNTCHDMDYESRLLFQIKDRK